MAFNIDLNEAPLPSPRQQQQPTETSFSTAFHICSVCRKAVSAGRRVDLVTDEQRKSFKCFNCLLKGTSSSSNTGAGGGFDINASPPMETDGGGIKTVASTQVTSSSHLSTTRNHLLASSGFQGMSRQMHSGGNFGIFGTKSSFLGGTQSNLNSSAHAPDSPNMVYLNTLREYIAESNGFLGEGWQVEFAFCDKSYKTSAVYISPDGNKLNSMEDVARYLGLTPNYHCIETGNRVGGISKSGVNTSNKGHAANSTAQNYIVDDIHSGFPIQFQDFCLMSAGNIDLRPSYHNTCQIFPVGYRSSWHDRITGSLFVCEIADGGDFGPIYKVYRYPCSNHSIPICNTILSTTKLGSGKEDGRFGKDDPVTFHVADDESSSLMALLHEDNPPCLDVSLSEMGNSPDSHTNCLVQRTGNSEALYLNDIEFQVECRSSSSAWEKVSQAFLYALHEKFKQNGSIKLFCDHDIIGASKENLGSIDSLSRFGSSFGPLDIQPLVQNEDMFKTTCEKLYTWLNHDRFGLDADFAQDIIEKNPGVAACSEYKSLNLRKESEALQTIGNGFFQEERRTSEVLGAHKCSKLLSGTDIALLKRDPCPPGKLLSSKLPSNLIGDVLEVWELAWRFMDVLGLGEPFSFQELESEILSASFGGFPHETMNTDDSVLSKREQGSEAGLLTEIISSLLKLLVCELLSKVAVYVCPNLDVGEFKTRKGKRKEYDSSKKTKLDMLPVNELTWQEIARRYILAVFSVEGNLDSAEVATRESGKVFHCLQGDGGWFCGCLSGITALEADAMVLADATKHIFGCSLKSKNEIFNLSEKQDACGDLKIELNDDDDAVPEWSRALEPVRKLPTNVGARLRKCVYEALEKNPPEWAKTILEHSISKEVYKGNASGPTKRAVVSVLDKMSNANTMPKSEKKEKKKIKTNVTNLITKQCRIVLRRAASADQERVFCNLLGRSTLNCNDNDDEGLLGSPALVSRPLDFRTIDLRLAAGFYDGLHEAFLDDVREVWSNIRTIYGDRSDLNDIAVNLSRTFEDLYEKEVQTLLGKIVDASINNEERDELFADVVKSSIPRAPWEDGICKTCAMDKDDDSVLLCDKCDSGYHRYCLIPPLLKIPEGNWFCPACVSGSSVPSSAVSGLLGNQNSKRRHQGELRKIFEGLARLSKLMDVKEFLEFNIDEKTYFLKFLFGEVLNTTAVHEHFEHCASRTTELQQKLRHLTSEMKILKFKEEMIVLNVNKENSTVCSGRAEVQSDVSSSFLTTTSESLNQSQNRQILRGQNQSEHISHAPILRRPSCKSDQNSLLSTSQATPDHNSSGSTHERQDELPDMATLQDNDEKMRTIKNEISEMQKSFASAEHELFKLSLRKNYLGRDCNGRAYWAFHSHNARAWIISNGSMSSDKKLLGEFEGIPDPDRWMSYETNKETEELFKWLRDDDVREKELKDAIWQLQISKSKDAEYTEKHVLAREETEPLNFSRRIKSSSNNSLGTKAVRALETKFGPWTGTVNEENYQNLATGSRIAGKLFRCKCLEPLWDSRSHCLCCHRTFQNDEQLKQHAAGCKTPVPSTAKRSMPTEDPPSCKKLKILISAGKIVQMTDNQIDGSGFSKRHPEPDCPYKLEEIISRFTVPESLKDEANSIGLIGSGGVPALLHGDFRSHSLIEESNTLSRSAERGLRTEQVFFDGDTSSFYWLGGSSMTSVSSSRKLFGRASEILKVLKINLLDMDAALPEDAFRPSRSCEDRRCAWRAFVKSAGSIYEMVEATLIFEDAIKSDFLSSNWWYWSSPSTAAKISTVSALALRIYALDSAISYEKPIPSGKPEEQMLTVPSSPPLQKTTRPDTTETPRTRTRSSKRRKDMTG